MKDTLHKPNIYHVLFDGFYSIAFRNALKNRDVMNLFNGFTFFEKNRSNYDDTFASNSSLRSGSYYSGGSFKSWDNVQLNPGLFGKINFWGYQLNQYTDNHNILYDNAVEIKLNEQMLHEYKLKTSTAVRLLMLYNGLTKYILSERIGKGARLAFSTLFKPFDIWFESKKDFPSFPLDGFLLSDFILSLPLMLCFINNEKYRPGSKQYNFIHIMQPHSPFVWTPSFTYSQSSFEEQVLCSINLMNFLIIELKRLGRFENSMIIFHADHGWSDTGLSYPFLDEIPKSILDKIEKTILHPPSRFLNRSHSLLMIKPPGSDSRKPLEISNRLTQLVDIPSTISHLLGWDIQTEQGSPIFSDQWDEHREIHMFAGLHRYNRLGLKCNFGKHFLRGGLAHFSLTADNEWRIYPDLPISWR